MSSSKPARTPDGRARSTVVAALAVVGAALIGVVGYPSLTSSTSSIAHPTPAPSALSATPPSIVDQPGELPVQGPDGLRSSDHRGALGEADGALPDGVTVFDDQIPAVANLDPALLDALRRAATHSGVEFAVTSGWRSPEYQEQLLREAITKYGSRAEAARWVATPETSAHVSGGAVDIGNAAAAWLSRHGAEYGLCQIYDNEPWHYELRLGAIDHGCPTRYADPTHDPRMQP